jgi:hypothetical protein
MPRQEYYVRYQSSDAKTRVLRQIVKESRIKPGYSWMVFERTRPLPPFPAGNGQDSIKNKTCYKFMVIVSSYTFACGITA